ISKYLRMQSGGPLYDAEFPWPVAATSGFQDRFWFDLEETRWGGKAELETPAEWLFMQDGSEVKGGVFGFGKGREYIARPLRCAPGADIQEAPEKYGRPYEDFFDLLNGAANSGYVTNRNQNEKDSYSVADFQWAAHVQGDAVLSDEWRVITG